MCSMAASAQIFRSAGWLPTLAFFKILATRRKKAWLVQWLVATHIAGAAFAGDFSGQSNTISLLILGPTAPSAFNSHPQIDARAFQGFRDTHLHLPQA